MIMKFLTNDIYIKIYENKLVAKNLSTNGIWESIYPEADFTTERLLVGNFSEADKALTKLVKNILEKGIISKTPQLIIHPLEKVEGGLSQVEERIFIELGRGAGAQKITLHIGSELSDSEAIQLISNA